MSIWRLFERSRPETPSDAQEADPEKEPRGLESMLYLDASHVSDAMRECCALRMPVTVIVPDASVVHGGRFVLCLDNRVEVDLQGRPLDVFRPLVVCCLVFYRGGRAFLGIFVTREYQPAGAGRCARVIFSLPTQIIGADMRESFRVPILPGCNLKASLTVEDGRTWTVMPCDMSLGGIGLIFPPGEDPALEPGTRLVVRLEFDGERSVLAGEVRRASEGRYGIFFYENLHFDELRTPDSFRRMVTALERYWLQNRAE